MEEYDGDLRFNFRHFPLTHIHQRSFKSQRSRCAAGQVGRILGNAQCIIRQPPLLWVQPA
jgi:hypothetical protein